MAPAVICHKIELEDANDLRQVVERVNQIYQQAASLGLGPTRIIADITGGTSAMSGGITLATLSDDRNLQYLGQGVKLIDPSTHA